MGRSIFVITFEEQRFLMRLPCYDFIAKRYSIVRVNRLYFIRMLKTDMELYSLQYNNHSCFKIGASSKILPTNSKNQL